MLKGSFTCRNAKHGRPWCMVDTGARQKVVGEKITRIVFIAALLVSHGTDLKTWVLERPAHCIPNYTYSRQTCKQQARCACHATAGTILGPCTQQAQCVCPCQVQYWAPAHSKHNACATQPQVQYWAPAASGAGVTLVMAYLNGERMQ